MKKIDKQHKQRKNKQNKLYQRDPNKGLCKIWFVFKSFSNTFQNFQQLSKNFSEIGKLLKTKKKERKREKEKAKREKEKVSKGILRGKVKMDREGSVSRRMTVVNRRQRNPRVT